MNPIRTNKPVFFGDDGEVLKSGQIYIGQPNQWPLSFPKTVTLQDSAGSQFTAAQPLKTGTDGRITYNGKSVIALVGGDYSILVRDRNGVTVGEGYTPFVENSDSGGGVIDGGTQVGTLLSDIKQFNVTPGETVRNVGKSSALDGLGADWLVVSSTGSPGDDVDLIDFANGTQGRRIQNDLYRKDFDPAAPGLVWEGVSTTVPYSALSESGTGYYFVETINSGFLVYFIENDPVDEFFVFSGTSLAQIAGGDLEVRGARISYSSAESDLVFEVKSYQSDGTQSSSSIRKIYKV